jgi:hypothetical protein
MTRFVRSGSCSKASCKNNEMEGCATLQFDFDPRVLAISTVVVILSSAFIVAMQRLVGLDLILPGSARAQ